MEHEHVSPAPAPQPPAFQKWSRSCFSGPRIFVFTFFKTIAVTSGIFLTILVWGFVMWSLEKPSCNVSVRSLHGTLDTYPLGGDETASGDLVRMLMQDENDQTIKSVILDIDSPGGLPVAGEEVAKQLEHMTKPTVAMIRSSGTSAAYWAATGARRIFASADSDVGSIGVIASLTDETEKNKREGIVYNDLVSAKYKDLGDPNHPLSRDERDLLMRDINIIHDHFVVQVSRARHLSLEKVKALADGSSMTGASAKDAGLIDEVGGIHEIEAYLRVSMDAEPVLCAPDAPAVSSESRAFQFWSN